MRPLSPIRLAAAGVRHFARTHVATGFALAVLTAAMTGALLVGDSVRTSLYDAAVSRLGPYDYALTPNRFFHSDLVDGFSRRTASHFSGTAVGVIQLAGGVNHAESGRRAGSVQAWGVPQSFLLQLSLNPIPSGRTVVLNDVLAREIDANVGDDVLLRVRKPADISEETLLGRRDEMTATLRVTVAAIVSARDLGAFGLSPGEFQPRNAFVPLEMLQRAIGQVERVNTLLIDASAQGTGSGDDDSRTGRPLLQVLKETLAQELVLADLGLTIRTSRDKLWHSLESDGFLIDPRIERAAQEAADDIGSPRQEVLAYLANTISVKRTGTAAPAGSCEVPYSIVIGLGDSPSGPSSLKLVDGTPAPRLDSNEILLNDWTARELGANVGDTVCLDYFVTAEFGELETKQACFSVRGVVATESTADPTWTPEYKGITDAKNLADWNPPFPLDVTRIRAADEDYWDQYAAAPKAVVSLADARRLWAEHGERFGRLTAIRFAPAPGLTPSETRAKLETKLRERLDWPGFGFDVRPVREHMAAASRGSTDFGWLFVGFSFFLIFAAATLAALVFRLLVERRASEVGLLLATGHTARNIIRLLLYEGLLVAGAGVLAGLVGSVGYSWMMLVGLSTWWAQALQGPALRLSLTATSLAIGLSAGFLISLGAMALAVRGVAKHPPRALLAGAMRADSGIAPPAKRRISWAAAVVLALGAMAITFAPVISEQIPPAGAFFAGGALLLAAAIELCRVTLRGTVIRSSLTCPSNSLVLSAGAASSPLHLALSNLRRHPSRSVMTMTLIASAVFVIVSVGAFRLDVHEAADRSSGTGGFALMAESDIPVPFDLNSPMGRRNLNIDEEKSALIARTEVMPFRLRPGDDASCKNPYGKTMPRIVGATEKFIARGGFSFAESMAQNSDERANPWRLLHRDLAGVIPVIADESAVRWQLHAKLGDDLSIPDDHGRLHKLRIVGMLKNSVLQSELIVAESNFTRLFPARSGYSFFLIDTLSMEGAGAARGHREPSPSSQAWEAPETNDKIERLNRPPVTNETLSAALETSLAAYVFDVQSTVDRLGEYLAVQNTYISTFQTLGGLGLILGVAGLSAILIRQVWERRAELALMTALGFRRRDVRRIVLLENMAVLFAGVVIGGACAMVAIAPQWISQPWAIPWIKLAGTLGFVVGLGLVLATMALTSALKKPLLPALRSE